MAAQSLAAGSVNLGIDSTDISFYGVSAAIGCIFAQEIKYDKLTRAIYAHLDYVAAKVRGERSKRPSPVKWRK